MGYDMNLVTTPTDEDKRARDYFRLNIWGMGIYADLMLSLGMVYNSNNAMPWPEWNRYPEDEQRQGWFDNAREHLGHDEPLDPTVPADVLEIAREHVSAEKAVLRFHPAGGDTIPLHKFGSNDGWIVTPEELKAALAAYESAGDRESTLAGTLTTPDRRGHWQRWIDYLRLAIDYDGFEVW